MNAIKALQAVNLGMSPLIRVAFDGSGFTEIVGDSGTGKSCVIDGLCYALLGTGANGKPLPPSYKEGDTTTPKVAVRFADGAVLTREGARRTLARDGATETFTTQTALADKIGLGVPEGARMSDEEADATRTTRTALDRLILTPFLSDRARTRELLDTKLGRPFRDLLVALLPPDDVRGVIMRMMAAHELALRPSDAVDLKTALADQTAANAARDRATGAMESATARANRIVAAPVREASERDRTEAAKALIANAETWSRHTGGSSRRTGLLARKAEVETRLAVASPEPVKSDWIAKATAWIAA